MKVVYPGTFDPITNGHLDIIERAQNLFDEVIIAVGDDNSMKKTVLTAIERKQLIEESLKGKDGIRVEIFSELLVDFMKKAGSRIIIRGLRAISDFDYEFQMAVMNKRYAGDIETIFLMTDKDNFYLSSSLITTIASHGGDVSELVPPPVKKRLKELYH